MEMTVENFHKFLYDLATGLSRVKRSLRRSRVSGPISLSKTALKELDLQVTFQTTISLGQTLLAPMVVLLK